MGGKIWVESVVNVGSAFHITIPFPYQKSLQADTTVSGAFQQPGNAASPSEDEQPQALNDSVSQENASQTILVVDDNRINQKLAAALLEHHGYHVVIAENGEVALEVLDTQEVHVVLMDLQMPVLDGIAATSCIREREKETGARLPIIALTAHATEQDRQRCLQAGMDDYISKPFKRADFYAVVERFLQKQ
ncbi:response regulator [Oligoflexia bacterium]|nr:response regulator [Oligoflexia bacterium]